MKPKLVRFLHLLFLAALPILAQSVTRNPDGTITAISGSQVETRLVCTFLPLRYSDVDNGLRYECQQGALVIAAAWSLVGPEILTHQIFRRGMYVAWTLSADAWVILAGPAMLTGSWPKPPPAPAGPVTVGTLDATGTCQAATPPFTLVPGPPARMEAQTANCILR